MKRLRRLSGRRSARRSEGCYLIDGPVLVGEALSCGAELHEVFAESGAPPALLEEAAARGVVVRPVEDGALRKVLDLVSPQSIVAVGPIKTVGPAGLCRTASDEGAPLIALVGIQDPGNAGTLIRVAEAAGCAGVVFCVSSVDPWNPKAVRASAGSILRVPVAVDADPSELAGYAREAGMALVATVARAGRAPEQTRLGGACLLLVGAEAGGLPEELVAAATDLVSVPMAGRVESLNAAVSGALVAFEAARQRRALQTVGSEDPRVGQNAQSPARTPLEDRE